MVQKLPAGWRVELLGLISSVRFSNEEGRLLVWGDGEWSMGNGHIMMRARGVPKASDMKTARVVGTAFLSSLEAVATNRRLQ